MGAAVAIITIGVLAGDPCFAQQGTGEDMAEAAAAIRAQIAEFATDDAAKAISAFKAKHKSAEAKAIERDLSAELVKARKLRAPAQQIRKLIDAENHSDAYALGVSTLEAFPGALGAAAVRKLAREARDAVYLTIGDFDDHGDTLAYPWETQGSASELVPDGRGGKAVHWLTHAVPTNISLKTKRIGDGIDLAAFESVSLRIRAPKRPAGQVGVRFYNQKSSDQAFAMVDIKPTAEWQEPTISLDKLTREGNFDPKAVVAFDVAYNGLSEAEFFIDDILLARKR